MSNPTVQIPHKLAESLCMKTNVIIHAYTLTDHSKRLNGKLCGARGGSPYTTGHIKGMTCRNCLRIISKSQKLSLAYSE